MNPSCNCDWSKLHDYILGEIIQKLILVDFIRFAAVCKSWRLVSLENPSKKHLLLPCLIFPTQHTKTCEVYNILDKQVSHFPLYTPYELTYYGSSFGWLVTLHWTHKMYDIQLINPFHSINKTIDLPPLPSDLLHNDYRRIRNFVLSANPAKGYNGYEIMGIFGWRSLVYFKPGRRAWSLIEWKEALGDGIRSVIFFKKTNQFYAVDGSGAVVGINLKPIPTLARVAPSNPNHGWLNTYIIVESASGELLQVHKPNFSSMKCEFYVDKLDQVTGEWIPMFSLGNQMMFLSLHYSSCLSASEYIVCKSNCIYFTDYWSPLDRSLQMRVFNFEDRTTEAQCDFDSEMLGHIPIWIQPTIQGIM